MSLCQLSLPDTSFEEDIEIAKVVGAGGLGVFDAKLTGKDLTRLAALLAEADLKATICSPGFVTILPQVEFSRFGGPADLDQRIEEMAEGIRRMAKLGADTVLVVTGPSGHLSEGQARSAVVGAMRDLADVAAAAGTRLAIETMREAARGNWTIVTTLAQTASLLEEVGRDNVGIVLDTWHMWDAPRLWEDLPVVIDRIFGVQVADYRSPYARDRVVAGDGVAPLPELLGTLEKLGFDGWYDMEVFSDDGRFGVEFPDSLWKLEPVEFARRQIAGFHKCWSFRSPNERRAPGLPKGGSMG